MPFGGIIVVLGGDFRQILPVIIRASCGKIIYSSITRSKLWKIVRVFKLKHNMRLNRGNNLEDVQSLRDFAAWVLDVSDGKMGTPNRRTDGEGGDDIFVPKSFCHLGSKITVKSMMENAFSNFTQHYQDPDYLSERAILAPTNQTVGRVSSLIVEKIPG
ncbi:uncharacterized protein LOC141718517 [Apium graveolens]|uniref:uncharacterized protein LOC141718517 n=1 Tax=Apium graveolens TaxID=4045 RepID=UPI003D7A5DBF